MACSGGPEGPQHAGQVLVGEEGLCSLCGMVGSLQDDLSFAHSILNTSGPGGGETKEREKQGGRDMGRFEVKPVICANGVRDREERWI